MEDSNHTKLNPVISILMPVFNAGNFLETTLNSIINQSILDWELIAIDDFSSDNSKEIVLEFSRKEPRIKIYSNNQKGIIPALRLAFSHSKGHFITRMDADDIMPNIKLEYLINELKRQGRKSIVTGKVQYFSDLGLMEGFIKYEKWINTMCDLQNHYNSI